MAAEVADYFCFLFFLKPSHLGSFVCDLVLPMVLTTLLLELDILSPVF